MDLKRIKNIQIITTKDNCIIYYIDGICDIKYFYAHFYDEIKNNRDKRIDNLFPGICKEIKYSELLNFLYEGEIGILRNNIYYHIDLVTNLSRSITDSIIEPEGALQARDGFTDYIKTNISLLRTRIKEDKLNIEMSEIGRRSKTKIALFSIDDISNKEIKNKIIEVLNSIDIDAVLSIDDITAYFQKKHLFPITQYVGSPDLAAKRIYDGEFVILIDRLALALVLPINITSITKLPIDKTVIPFFTIIERLLLIFCSVLATVGLGLFSAGISIDSDFLSLRWLSILKKLEGEVVLPSYFQIMIVLSIFELLYVITFRQSKITLSSTIVLVGGLIIGENLATSGIAGVIIITFTAIVFLSGFMISTNISVLINISIIRLLTLFLGTILGFYGVLITSIALMALLYNEKLFGVHYFYPIMPLDIKDLGLFFKSSSSLKSYLRDINLKVYDRRRRG